MPKQKKKKLGTLLIIIGAVCICAALCLFFYNLAQNLNAKKSSQNLYEQLLDESEVSSNTEDPYADLPVAVVNGVECIGYLLIPSLGLELPVANNWSYSLLTICPCRYNGHPNKGDFVICGHNYASHFGKLKNMSSGAQVVFVAMDGRRWEYEVKYLGTYKPTDVDKMLSGEYDLMLFTCNYSGLARVTVGCSLENFM